MSDMPPDRPKTTTKFPAVTPRQTLPASVPPASTPASRPSMSSLGALEELEVDTEVGRRPAIEEAPTSARRDRAVLTVLSGVHAGEIFSLNVPEVFIGRGRDVAFRIDDVGISRKHTRIMRGDDGVFYVEDQGSTNGTFVGGQRVERAALSSGDRVQIGPNVVLRFAFLDPTEEELARALYEASTRDALTRAFNRKHFNERIASEVAYGVRHQTRVSVLIFDLDHFKKINDAHGHLAGDVVLRVVAAQVQKTIRIEDLLARYGGEEFVILVRGIEQGKAGLFGERVRRAVERLEIPWEGKTLRATISVGVASLEECTSPPRADEPDETSAAILALADARLYRAKDDGRNRVCSS